MYNITCSRTDVLYNLSMLSRYHGNLGESHWMIVKNILKYLTITTNMFLFYGGMEDLKVTCYNDVCYQTDKDESCSQSRWVLLINGGEVTWKNSKQKKVADYMCESEYIAASEAAKEATWLKNSSVILVLFLASVNPLICDNNGTATLTKECKDHGKSIHILTKYYYVRKQVNEVDIIVDRVSS